MVDTSSPFARLPEVLRGLRHSANLTQREAAAHLGIQDRTISKYECGDVLPPLDKLGELLKLYGISLMDLAAKLEGGHVREEDSVPQEELILTPGGFQREALTDLIHEIVTVEVQKELKRHGTE